MISEKLGSLLVEQGKITPGELSLGVAVQSVLDQHEQLGSILQHYDFLNEQDLVEVLARQSGWSVFSGSFDVDLLAARRLGFELLQARRLIPLTDALGLVFVMCDPYDTRTTDHVLSHYPQARFKVAGISKVVAALDALNREESKGRSNFSPQDSVPDAALSLMDEAAMMGATDIHIEPSEKAVEVRFRIDGVLRFYRSFSRKEHLRLVNIFFHRAEISAGDVLRFHDARFDHVCGVRKIDVRLSHIPSIHGSSLVLRLLDKSRSVMSLEELGYACEHRKIIDHILRQPHGIILLTGPTGCGKTTSLYAMLSDLKNVGIKVVSVEDPVEIKLPLVTQVPVDLKKGHDFDHVTRALLRHDPDIILIGEIRDAKTAAEAVRAAVTGHRVLSTLHTNDAVSAILRLHDLGIDHSYIANTLNGVIAQRLVRKLCCHCRREEFATPQSVAAHERKFITGPGHVIYQADPKGCMACYGGYHGRTVLAQTLVIDDEIRFMIEQGLVNEIFLKVRERSAMSGFAADASRLVREGIISMDEAVRVVG
ncbi:MAG: type II/IV secretion system protein [Candidatus Omnitrophica bacterium]|nr:type II/IV secretion system protein [Candidatus Omnitrophota bacterium]